VHACFKPTSSFDGKILNFVELVHFQPGPKYETEFFKFWILFPLTTEEVLP